MRTQALNHDAACESGHLSVERTESLLQTPHYLIISRHDYRSKRKASVHFIADELAKAGKIRFFSSSFSLLSWIKSDQRLPLWNQANRIEIRDGVECYLWRTAIHPFRVDLAFDPMMDVYFRRYAHSVPVTLQEWIAEADTVFLESGGPEIFFDAVKQINPGCKVVYLYNDNLETIGCSSYVRRQMRRVSRDFDVIQVPSKKMAADFPRGCKLYFIPQGVSDELTQGAQISPYNGGTNLVSVGNMLFDPGFFQICAAAFPDVTFHVIGAGPSARKLRAPNIIVYPEMPFKETLAYLKYADAGIAAYLGSKVRSYLADTSLKLRQYGNFGLPAICPHAATGSHQGRFGYDPGNRESMISAVKAALAFGRFEETPMLSWKELTKRLLAPEDFPDTRLQAHQTI